MDIQFVLDPFSCIVYVVSYISKAEREMGMLLKQTKIEANEGNMNANETMKKNMDQLTCVTVRSVLRKRFIEFAI